MATQTIKQLEDSLVQLITAAIGWDAEDERVRIAWQGENAPFIPSTWDCCYVHLTPGEDAAGGFRDVTFSGTFTASQTGITVMECACIFYGDNAVASAIRLREYLFSPVSCDALHAAGIYPLPRLPQVQRVPELINQKWWERADLSFSFNTPADDAFSIGYADTLGPVGLHVNK